MGVLWYIVHWAFKSLLHAGHCQYNSEDNRYHSCLYETWNWVSDIGNRRLRVLYVYSGKIQADLSLSRGLPCGELFDLYAGFMDKNPLEHFAPFLFHC